MIFLNLFSIVKKKKPFFQYFTDTGVVKRNEDTQIELMVV